MLWWVFQGGSYPLSYLPMTDAPSKCASWILLPQSYFTYLSFFKNVTLQTSYHYFFSHKIWTLFVALRSPSDMSFAVPAFSTNFSSKQQLVLPYRSCRYTAHKQKNKNLHWTTDYAFWILFQDIISRNCSALGFEHREYAQEWSSCSTAVWLMVPD